MKLTVNQSTLEAMEIRWKNRLKDRLLLGFTASVAEVQKNTPTNTTAGREGYTTECWRREEKTKKLNKQGSLLLLKNEKGI